MKKRILIEGMSCNHCVNHVKEALSELNGVSNVEVNLAAKYAVIETKDDIKDEDIRFVIDDAGYEVTEIQEV
ncbi:copper ion binding protein [Clostridium punense]|uniref:Copper ion binding protein n=1 Tax=Clostridium punense TaxID=1054297 RepID=A0ABS4K6J1_9CLOT|nr:MULTISPECIES: heavy metal-associated domain-containing protein [Clostridium]EQB86153.1 hypothetical protein M918_15670 [Clostridium sp. BL8]MBP2022866.1 copper ion binding protein [Clostridium punense]